MYLCVSMYTGVQALRGSEEGVGFPGAEVTVVSLTLSEYSELNWCFLEEQQVFLMLNHLFSPLKLFKWNNYVIK